VRHVEPPLVLLERGYHAHPADVVPPRDEALVPLLELVPLHDLVLHQVELHGVPHFDLGVGVPDGPRVVGHDVRHPVGAQLLVPHPEQLEAGLLLLDADQRESPLLVEQHPEVLLALVDGDDIHGSARETAVPADFVVDLDAVVLVVDDHHHLPPVHGILELPQDHRQGQALPEFVGSLAGSRRVDASELVQHPRLGGRDPFQVLLRTSRHLFNKLLWG
jgi:hypothetical protein